MYNGFISSPTMKGRNIPSVRIIVLFFLAVGLGKAQQTGLDGAVSIWLFEEGWGDIAVNAVDESFNGDIVDHKTWVAGMFGQALSFDGDMDAVEVPANPLIGAHALTVQAYIQPTGIPDENSSKIFNIALEGPGNPDRFMLDILPHDDGNRWVLSHFMNIEEVNTDPEEEGILEWGIFHPFDQWYHVAMVFDSLSEDSVLISHYVDHDLEYETRYLLDTLAGGAVFIGERYAPKGPVGEQIRNYFDGAMDNVVLHARALTPEEFMPAPGTADFGADPRSGPAPLEVSFANGSPSDVTSWSWDFGDGQSSTDENPTHTYTSAGTHTVILSVDGSAGPDTLTRADYIEVTSGPVGVHGDHTRPVAGFQLSQNYPNPFNPGTSIEYILGEPQYIKLSIYNIRGRLVRLLDEGYKPAGRFVLVWDGRDDSGILMNAGIYLFDLESALGDHIVKRSVLLR
ncbi:MAG: PKD domain-containing protein [Fidelibacterota bacterium]|nr:MAG: PKD domain-containing protein [Candidatus Neomarinimicrobiota bacterium]